MNLCILSGRLTSAPEIRYTNSKKAVCSFTVACDNGKDRDGNKMSVFIPCVAWEKTGELIDQYFIKGDPITVNGKIVPRSWEKDGKKNYITEVIVSGFEFPMTKKTPEKEPAPVNAFAEISEDIDLPF